MWEGDRRQEQISSEKGRLAQSPQQGWLSCWAPGIRVEWAEVPLAPGPLQQKFEDKEREQA